jgi:hypothetical protein
MQAGSWLAANAFAGLLTLLFIFSAIAVALPWMFFEIYFYIDKRKRCEDADGQVLRLMILVPWVLIGVAVFINVFVIPHPIEMNGIYD